MKGSYHIHLESRNVVYDISINRKVTILRGASATGKTLLIDLINTYLMQGESSGLVVRSEKRLAVLNSSLDAAIVQMTSLKDTIFLADEDARWTDTKEFADALKKSDGYFVIASREKLENIPYGIDSIYGLRESKKYVQEKRIYNENYNLYTGGHSLTRDTPQISHIITEDSNSGFEFFNAVGEQLGIGCLSMGGNSNIHSLSKCNSTIVDNSYIIVDGAAFGPYIESAIAVLKTLKGSFLFAPYSFEWLLLTSGIVRGVPRKLMDSPEDFAESKEFSSLEQYFYWVISKYSNGTMYEYHKKHLVPFYTSIKNITKVIDNVPILSTLWKIKIHNKKEE